MASSVKGISCYRLRSRLSAWRRSSWFGLCTGTINSLSITLLPNIPSRSVASNYLLFPNLESGGSILLLYPKKKSTEVNKQRAKLRSRAISCSKSLRGRERPSLGSPSSLLFAIKPLQGFARRPSGGSRRLTKGRITCRSVIKQNSEEWDRDWPQISINLRSLMRRLYRKESIPFVTLFLEYSLSNPKASLYSYQKLHKLRISDFIPRALAIFLRKKRKRKTLESKFCGIEVILDDECTCG